MWIVKGVKVMKKWKNIKRMCIGKAKSENSQDGKERMWRKNLKIVKMQKVRNGGELDTKERIEGQDEE